MSEQATPVDIARCGHIALFLRERLEERGWGIPDLAKAVGLSRTNTTPYSWLKGTSAPQAATRDKLAALFGVAAHTFAPRGPDGEPELFDEPEEQLPVKIIQAPPTEVLSFAADSHGQARIRVDVTLPVDKAMSLLRLLMDAGVVLGG